MKTPQEYEAIIAKQDEYIEYLGSHIKDNALFLHSHGIMISKEEFEKGRTLREELARLKK